MQAKQMRQSASEPLNVKHLFNAFCFLLLVHQRGIVPLMRDMWGKRAFGIPCFFSFLLMCAWAVVVTDPFMLLWVVIWLCCLAWRKLEAYRLVWGGALIPTWYDGRPVEAHKFTSDEVSAKLIVEPVIAGVLGVVLLLIYRECRLPVGGLPTFLLVGVLTLHLVERLKQTIWNRRLEGMSDAPFRSKKPWFGSTGNVSEGE